MEVILNVDLEGFFKYLSEKYKFDNEKEYKKFKGNNNDVFDVGSVEYYLEIFDFLEYLADKNKFDYDNEFYVFQGKE